MNTSSFGMFLRASRTGFYFSRDHNAYIRITDEEQTSEQTNNERRFWVEFCPSEQLFAVTQDKGRKHQVEHYVLTEEVFRGLLAFNDKRYLKVLVDYDGKVTS